DLPEIAIMVGASLSHRIGLATGNILGGVAMQTAILILLDAFGAQGKYPLTSRLKSLIPVLEASLVVMVLITAILTSELPPINVPVGEIGVTIFWITGLWLINKARSKLPWQEKSFPEITEIDQDTAKLQVEQNEEQHQHFGIIWMIF